MTLFWVLAGVLALLALLSVLLPALRDRSAVSGGGAIFIAGGSLLAVGLAVALYARLSNWDWKSVSPEVQKAMDQLGALRRATDASPQDTQAWLRLGAAYLGMEQFASAQRSFEHANRLAQGRNAEALAGMAESQLLAIAAGAGNAAAATERAAQLFEQVLALEPNNGKALFYSGVIAMQRGNAALARERFVTMRNSGVPAEVGAALDRQIAALDQQLKPAAVDAATAIRLHIGISDALRTRVPAQAQLFVFVRGAAGGPPLAVKRQAATVPLDVTLSAADSMIAGNGIKPGQKVNVVARISATGGPTAQSGDPFGELATTAGAKDVQTILIDRLSP